MFSMQALQFRSFLSELQRWRVRLLVTSRCQLGCGLNGASQLHLASLTQDDAVALLRFEAGEQAVTMEQASSLASVCGCNALALTIIGGFIACERVTAEVGPESYHVLHIVAMEDLAHEHMYYAFICVRSQTANWDS